jgi:hypothetical protein
MIEFCLYIRQVNTHWRGNGGDLSIVGNHSKPGFKKDPEENSIDSVAAGLLGIQNLEQDGRTI